MIDLLNWPIISIHLDTSATSAFLLRPLTLWQTEGLIGSIITLLGLDFAVPDHTTLCRGVISPEFVALCFY